MNHTASVSPQRLLFSGTCNEQKGILLMDPKLGAVIRRLTDSSANCQTSAAVVFLHANIRSALRVSLLGGRIESVFWVSASGQRPGEL